MCGIAGFAGFFEPGLLGRMCQTIVHRGPDGEGLAEFPNTDGDRNAAAAIIDLVTATTFVSADDLVSLVFQWRNLQFSRTA